MWFGLIAAAFLLFSSSSPPTDDGTPTLPPTGLINLHDHFGWLPGPLGSVLGSIGQVSTNGEGHCTAPRHTHSGCVPSTHRQASASLPPRPEAPAWCPMLVFITWILACMAQALMGSPVTRLVSVLTSFVPPVPMPAEPADPAEAPEESKATFTAHNDPLWSCVGKPRASHKRAPRPRVSPGGPRLEAESRALESLGS